MISVAPESTLSSSSAAAEVYKGQEMGCALIYGWNSKPATVLKKLESSTGLAKVMVGA